MTNDVNLEFFFIEFQREMWLIHKKFKKYQIKPEGMRKYKIHGFYRLIKVKHIKNQGN